MEVVIKGQFLENGKYHSTKNNCDVLFTSLLVGNSVVQVKGVHQPSSVNRMDNITLNVDLRAYNNQLSATYIGR